MSSGTAAGLSTDFAALNTALNAGGIFYSRNFDLKRGGLIIGNEVQAHQVSVSVDDVTAGSTAVGGVTVNNGEIIVEGAINASGVTPGTIRLSGQTGLTIDSTGVLDAHGTVLQVDSNKSSLYPDGQPIDALNQGYVELAAPKGTLTLKPNATIDVSTPDGVARGDIELDAARTSETGGDIAIDASGLLNIKGAATIAVNAFWTYVPTNPITPTSGPNGNNPYATSCRIMAIRTAIRRANRGRRGLRRSESDRRA